MPRTSHDPASIVKAVVDVLSVRAGLTLTIPFAFAAAARISHLVGKDLLTEMEVAGFLTNPIHLDQILTLERIEERANNVASLALFHAEFGRDAA